MDATKLAQLVTALGSGIVLLLSILGVIPSDKVDSLGLAVNQITGAVSGLILLLTPSLASLVKKSDGTPPPQGGYARLDLMMWLSFGLMVAVALSVQGCAQVQSVATSPQTGRLSPEQVIKAGNDAVGEYFRRTVMLEAAGVINPSQAMQRDVTAKQAINVLHTARVALESCRTTNPQVLQCFGVEDAMNRFPDLMDAAEIALLKRMNK